MKIIYAALFVSSVVTAAIAWRKLENTMSTRPLSSLERTLLGALLLASVDAILLIG